MKKKNPSRLFRDDYRIARAAFLVAADEAGLTRHEQYINPHGRGPHDEVLTVDVIRSGPTKAKAVLFVSSGLHGIEGYAGSAIQTNSVQNGQLADLPKDMAVVYVHGLNPYGFAWGHRTNENNVDLNRNFLNWKDTLPAEHALTAELNHILLPAAWQWPTPGLMKFHDEHGMKALQDAITQGQYSQAKGLFYGGTQAEWSARTWGAIVKKYTSRAEVAGHIDLHTGLGAYGHGSILISKPASDPMAVRARDWWGDVSSPADGESITSDLSGTIGTEFDRAARNIEFTRATLEFGTLPPLQVLEALAMDNWVRFKGDRWSLKEKTAREKMRAAFCPDDSEWHKAVLKRGDDVLRQTKEGLIQSLR